MDLSLEDICYAAGFFDAEGCVRVSKYTQKNTFYVQLRITSTDINVLKWFKNRFGGSIGTQPPNKKVRKCRPCWWWVTCSRIACNFLKTVYPFLVIKKEQAALAMELQSRIKRGDSFIPENELMLRGEICKKISTIKGVQHLVKCDSNLPDEYIAGFLDGEGSILIYKIRDYYELRVSVTNTNRSILEVLLSKFRGFIAKKNDRLSVRTLQCFDWFVQGEDAALFLSKISQYLVTKKNQATIGAEFQKNKKDLKNSKEVLRDHIPLFQSFKDRISTLNQGAHQEAPGFPGA